MADVLDQFKHLKFYDKASGRQMALVYEYTNAGKDWIFYRHPDGQWVSLREASDGDRRSINAAVASAHHKRFE